jgi:hypothetical protein
MADRPYDSILGTDVMQRKVLQFNQRRPFACRAREDYWFMGIFSRGKGSVSRTPSPTFGFCYTSHGSEYAAPEHNTIIVQALRPVAVLMLGSNDEGSFQCSPSRSSELSPLHGRRQVFTIHKCSHLHDPSSSFLENYIIGHKTKSSSFGGLVEPSHPKASFLSPRLVQFSN